MNASDRTILQALLAHTAFQTLHAPHDIDRRYWSAQNDALTELQRQFNDHVETERKASQRTEDSFDADDGPTPEKR